MSEQVVPPPAFDPPPAPEVMQPQSPTQPEPAPAQVFINDEDLGSMVEIKEAKVERAQQTFNKIKAELEAEQAGLTALKAARERLTSGGSVVMTLHS